MRRPKSICNHPGCTALIPAPGYCSAHTKDKSAPFRKLDERKTDEAKRFYASSRWRKTSEAHRRNEPLCRRCRAAGFVVPGTLVHHNPPRETLMARGLSPYDPQHLETLCDWHHLQELRAKRGW